MNIATKENATHIIIPIISEAIDRDKLRFLAKNTGITPAANQVTAIFPKISAVILF